MQQRNWRVTRVMCGALSAIKILIMVSKAKVLFIYFLMCLSSVIEKKRDKGEMIRALNRVQGRIIRVLIRISTTCYFAILLCCTAIDYVFIILQNKPYWVEINNSLLQERSRLCIYVLHCISTRKKTHWWGKIEQILFQLNSWHHK